MTDIRPLDRALEAYLADGVNELADRVVDAALLQIDHTHQRRHLLAAWRFPAMTLQMRVATAAVIGVLVVAALAFLLRPTQVGPRQTTVPSPTATLGPSTPATAAAAWTVVQPPSIDHNNNGNVIALTDGRVLALGGADPISNVAEVFDPSTGSWQATNPMSTNRSYAVIARLTDGRVLVAGGGTPTGGLNSSVEIWDPVTGKWTGTTRMTTSRGQAFGVTLRDGRVLVAGGGDAASGSTAEIWDPATGAWTKTGSLGAGRASAQIPVVLSDGRVLVVGGFTSDPREAELFDPATGTWAVTGRASTPKGDEQTSVTLADGRVLFFAGDPGVGEIYNPTTGTWSATPATLVPHHDYLASALLGDGRVLLVSHGEDEKAAVAEIFDPVAGTWASAGTTVAVSFIRSAVRLADGSVLVVGATLAGDGRPLAEIYRPG